MSATFGRLSPAVQYQIVNALGFSGLRPVQEQTIDAVLDDKNCVVLAPTAGGKTEAAFFPLLSRMDAEDWKPVSVVYVAPIRALLNNQEERLERYAGLIHAFVGDDRGGHLSAVLERLSRFCGRDVQRIGLSRRSAIRPTSCGGSRAARSGRASSSTLAGRGSRPRSWSIGSRARTTPRS